eukprot:4378901-Amphidinium_carterae.1
MSLLEAACQWMSCSQREGCCLVTDTFPQGGTTLDSTGKVVFHLQVTRLKRALVSASLFRYVASVCVHGCRLRHINPAITARQLTLPCPRQPVKDLGGYADAQGATLDMLPAVTCLEEVALH